MAVLRSPVSESGAGAGSRPLAAGPSNECAEVATGDQITETEIGEYSH